MEEIPRERGPWRAELQHTEIWTENQDTSVFMGLYMSCTVQRVICPCF